MTKATIAVAALAAVLVVLALAVSGRVFERDAAPETATIAAVAPAESTTAPPEESSQGVLYGRVTTDAGAVYEGRLRWGGDQEAFWGDFFNGTKRENPWAAHVPPERLVERRPVKIFGLRIASRSRRIDLARPFMARFGDIARIEARGRDVRVTHKSGTVFVLDRFEASDFDDGLRIWDERAGVVDLDSLQIGAVELLPTVGLEDAPRRLHGTVRTRRGELTGALQWNRWACLGSDELRGRTAEGPLAVPFDGVRSIARRSRDSSLVTLVDGREIVLSNARELGEGNRGIFVDDRRFGRALVSWDAFERVDFGEPGAIGSGPAYGDFPPGRPLAGRVLTRSGRRLAGRLVYDLDESETSETLDAAAGGVDYTVPFGRIAAITPRESGEDGEKWARVTLAGGMELRLDRAGDLGDGNGGVLVFSGDDGRAEHVPWSEIERIELADLDPQIGRSDL